MKYSEIIGLHDYFQPVYNIEYESTNYWKQFIPNDRFYEVLDKTLLSVNSSKIQNKLSIWLVGRYGTGKSHASSVIKHLLWDDFEDIDDYIETFSKVDLKERLKAFRKEKKIMPVILKGGGNVSDASSLSLEIERAVKKSLTKYQIEIQTKSDFERITDIINNKYLNWELIISEHPDLEMYVNNKDEIIRKLQNEDIEFLNIVERILSEKNIHFSHEKISIWLKEVTQELIKKEHADGLLIIWDEFTSILEKESISEIINEIQSIAELSPKENVYLYLISHRDYNQFGKNIQDILDKVKDRFHNLHYPMIPITTYQIISAALQKKNVGKWEEFRTKVYEDESLDRLVNLLTDNIDGKNIKNQIKDLYPIHPYTIFLATFLANNIGSTQRSIFNFIYDSEFGFLNFLNNDVDTKKFITSDSLWDFYAEELDRDKDNKFMQVLEKYNNYKKQIEEKSPLFLKVFKGILILNSLYRITDYSNPQTDKVSPHIENIKNLFTGTDVEAVVDSALTYIDKQEIIQKNPNNIFEIASTQLPRQEIDKEKENLRNQYKSITDIIEFENVKSTLENYFNEENGILRSTTVHFFSADTNIHILKNQLNKYFPVSYSINFAVFLQISNDETESIEKLIEQVVTDENFKHIIFINIQESFGEERYKSFIEYLARSHVFNNHSFSKDSAQEEAYALTILTKWIESINYIDLYASIFDQKIIRDVKEFGKYVNDEIAPRIFYKGIDTLKINVATVWKYQNAKKASEYILNAGDRKELETSLKANFKYIKELLKDIYSEYIVDNNLNVKDASISHPIIDVWKEVRNTISKASEKSVFNLAEELKYLIQPPWGLYTNILNMAVLSFALRSYINKLYIANTGVLINSITMRDKISEIFECWRRGGLECSKVNVRLGSDEEEQLVKELANLFDIIEFSGIQDIRWKIKEKIKEIGFPIWSLKYCVIEYDKQKEIIDRINKMVFELNDVEIDIDFIQLLLSDIQSNKFDLQQIIKAQNYEKGFINFIFYHAKDKINHQNIPEIMRFIKLRQPEEINWKEKDIENLILRWLLEQPSPGPEPGPGPRPLPPIPPIPPTPDKINMLKKKIRDLSDLEEVKSKLIKMLEENQIIAEILDKYF